jgi:hypothetical protein
MLEGRHVQIITFALPPLIKPRPSELGAASVGEERKRDMPVMEME